MSKDRDSNIELLRLVCMFMILLIHFTGHCIMECSEMFKQQSGIAILIPNLLHGLCWCAVNTFIIISGYYGIHPKAKSFFNLYLQCAFYAGILYLFHLYITDSQINRWCLYNTFMPFSYNPNWWFIPQYVILYILSPVLNKVVETTNKRQFVLFLLLMAIVVFYFGHYRQKMLPFLEGGFNFINFIFLYFIGRYLALYHHSSSNVHLQRIYYFGGYLCASLLMGFAGWYIMAYHLTAWNMTLEVNYAHPLCVIAAIYLFLLFQTFHIKNRVVNWFSASALSIYLLHNNSYSGKYLYDLVTNVYDTPPYRPFAIYIILISLALGLVMICPIIDKLRILITNPINRVLCKHWYKTKDLLKSKCE